MVTLISGSKIVKTLTHGLYRAGQITLPTSWKIIRSLHAMIGLLGHAGAPICGDFALEMFAVSLTVLNYDLRSSLSNAAR